MLDIKKFILEVKQRPAIYDINCIQYNDRNAKSSAWYEVCVAMVENWEELTSEERVVEAVEIFCGGFSLQRIQGDVLRVVCLSQIAASTSKQPNLFEVLFSASVNFSDRKREVLQILKCKRILRNKWRNIRDYFMKELKAPKKTKAGSKAGRKRKKYSYHNELLFLVPSVKSNKRVASRNSKSRSASAMQRMKNEVEIHEVIEIESTPQVEEFNLTGVSLAASETQRDMYQQHQTVACEASLASFDNDIPTDVLSTAHGNQRNFTSDDDYDKMFLLSLLPSLRCIPEHMKLHIRIQMQQVIASAFHPSNHHTE